MKTSQLFDLRNSCLNVGADATETLAVIEALRANKTGFARAVDVTGNVTGTRTDANTFTATSANFVANIIITHAAMTTPFTLGETVTETGTSATGVVVETAYTWTRLTSTSATPFAGNALLTGGTSGYTATGTGKTTALKTLTGKWAYSYNPSAPNDGVFLKITSNTATTCDVDGTLEATGTRLVIFDTEDDAYEAVSLAQADATNLGATLSGTTGGLTRKVAEATVTLTGASTDIAVNVPSGAKLIGTQLRVDTAVTSATATSWSAAYKTGNAESIASGQAFTKNTKVNKFFFDVDGTDITTDVTVITITPNTGTFTGGVIRALVYYEQFETLADAA